MPKQFFVSFKEVEDRDEEDSPHKQLQKQISQILGSSTFEEGEVLLDKDHTYKKVDLNESREDSSSDKNSYLDENQLNTVGKGGLQDLDFDLGLDLDFDLNLD